MEFSLFFDTERAGESESPKLQPDRYIVSMLFVMTRRIVVSLPLVPEWSDFVSKLSVRMHSRRYGFLRSILQRRLFEANIAVSGLAEWKSIAPLQPVPNVATLSLSPSAAA
jgi:hypothetical protein